MPPAPDLRRPRPRPAAGSASSTAFPVGFASAATFLLAATFLAPSRAAEPAPAPKERVKEAAERLVLVVEGDLPIILSAPHGGREVPPGVKLREGEGVRRFTVVRDDNTLELAERLAAAVEKRLGGKPHLAAARFERKYVDPNRSERDAFEGEEGRPFYDAYHAALSAACREVRAKYGWGLLVDLHGQAADADAVFRGTNDGKSVAHLVGRFGSGALVGPKSVLGMLAAPPRSWKVAPPNDSQDDEDPRYAGGFIVRRYGSREGGTIDALQLELGGSFRRTERLDRTADELAGALAAFHRAYLPQAPQKARDAEDDAAPKPPKAAVDVPK